MTKGLVRSKKRRNKAKLSFKELFDNRTTKYYSSFVMKQFSVGTKVICDFIFTKPEGVCVGVNKEGSGQSNKGEVLIKVIKDHKGYRKDEILTISSFEAVPKQMLKTSSTFTRVNTQYQWVKKI